MKRYLLIFCLLALVLSACHDWVPGSKDIVSFYYPRQEFSYGEAQGVYAQELRDMAGHREDLNYLLRMYLLGPQGEGLELPFPKGTQLLSIRETKDQVEMTLSDGDTMPEICFTLGCACLAKTYLELRQVSQITVVRGRQSITLNPSGLILFDKTTG